MISPFCSSHAGFFCDKISLFIHGGFGFLYLRSFLKRNWLVHQSTVKTFHRPVQIIIISGLKIHDFLRLSDINFGQCISPKTRLLTKCHARRPYKMSAFRGIRGACLVEFTTSRLLKLKSKNAKLAKKNTTAVDSLIYTADPLSVMWSMCCRFTFRHAPAFSESYCS